MSTRFRLLTEADVKAVLTMDDLIETMASALQRFSAGRVAQPIRTVIPVQVSGSGNTATVIGEIAFGAMTSRSCAAASPSSSPGR